MAKGRMLNKSISVSEKVADLAAAVGNDAALLFTWMIPHLDVEGRMQGGPRSIKAAVVPMLDTITAADVDRYLGAAEELGIIERYEAGGKRYVSFPGFAEEQTGLRKDRERASVIPPPPPRTPPGECREDSGVTPDDAPIREVKRREEKRNTAAAPPAGLSSLKTGPTFCEEVWAHWRVQHPRAGLVVPSGVSSMLLERKAEGRTVEDLKLACDGFHLDDWEGRKNHQMPRHVWGSDELVTKWIERAEQAQGKSNDGFSADYWEEVMNAHEVEHLGVLTGHEMLPWMQAGIEVARVIEVAKEAQDWREVAMALGVELGTRPAG